MRTDPVWDGARLRLRQTDPAVVGNDGKLKDGGAQVRDDAVALDDEL